MTNPISKQELDSFRKMILELVPAAQRIIKSALVLRKPKKDSDGKVVEAKIVPPKSVDLARYVLDQYAKMVVPGDSAVNELHIIDHAALAQMKKARDIIQEMNRHRMTNGRGLDIGLN